MATRPFHVPFVREDFRESSGEFGTVEWLCCWHMLTPRRFRLVTPVVLPPNDPFQRRPPRHPRRRRCLLAISPPPYRLGQPEYQTPPKPHRAILPLAESRAHPGSHAGDAPPRAGLLRERLRRSASSLRFARDISCSALHFHGRDRGWSGCNRRGRDGDGGRDGDNGAGRSGRSGRSEREVR
jgi:hypothetical protein